MREVPPRTLDAALAVVVLLEAMLEVSFADAPWGARLAAAGPVLLVAAAILLRRREPIGAIALAACGLSATGLLHETVSDALQGVFLGWILVVYFMAISESGRRLVIGIAVAELGTIAYALSSAGGDRAGELVAGSLFFVAGPVFAGRMLRARLELNRALRERAERLRADGHQRAEEAAVAERTRIAGELHDVVAHALSAMTVQASSAGRLATTDPPVAAEAFEAIELTGREALQELRTLLEVLRADEETEPDFEPQPGLAALSELTGRVRAAGLPVEVDVLGDRPAGLPASVDLTAYRIVQEALDEALREGEATSARVLIRYRPARLEVEVVDDGHEADGRRLLGLRERVRLYGGHVTTTAESGGGHAVRASLPLDRVPA